MDVSLLSLRKTLGAVSFVGAGDVLGRRFCADSRRVLPGDVFVAVSGAQQDGHTFISAAVQAGAVAVVSERPHPHIHVPQCIVPDSRAALARIGMALRGQPAKSLTVCGVTGTNGKTTTTWLLRSVLEACGHVSGLLGTIEYSCGRGSVPAVLTTPDAMELADWFSRMKNSGASHCVMELSSHALDQRRCDAVPLAGAAITNITQDHFDYHGNLENYVASKVRIGRCLTPGAPLLVGVDDPGARSVLSMLPGEIPVLTFGMCDSAQLRAEVTAQEICQQTIRLRLQSGSVEIRTPLIGRHNVLNILAAAGLAEILNASRAEIREGIERVEVIPGRMERIDAGQEFRVFVDYAHTPDGLQHSVATARTLTSGRVILVFGAGGNRDRLKRPHMARAAEHADSVVVTSDNPRFEPAAQILEEICSGFRRQADIHVEPDREKAIRLAIRMATSGDVVLIAGRGHETTQQICDRHISFDDRKVVRRLIRERLGTGHRTESAHAAIPA